MLAETFKLVPARFKAAVVDDPRVGGVPKLPAAGDDNREVEENKLPTPPILALVMLEVPPNPI